MTDVDPLTASRTTRRVERYDTIVIGGGQAGLAAGYHLAQQNVDFVILDAGPRIGESWRRRWDSLRLFTPARYSGLPGMPFPDAPMHLPDKDQVADYLERYAERFDLPVRMDTPVTFLGREGEHFTLRTSSGTFEADSVVVATGPLQRPRVPAVAAELQSDIRQLHSSQYRSPFDLVDGPVLVVGAGNSGAQVALELSRHYDVTLAGRDIKRLPRKILGGDVFHWTWPVFRRLSLDTWAGRWLRDRMTPDPLIGVGPRDFAAAGIKRVRPMTGVCDGVPCIDGARLNPRTVIWATGFSSDFTWIKLPAFEEGGAPTHTRGVSPLAGLYFLGLPFQYRQTSALIGGVGEDAAFIADHIARRTLSLEGAGAYPMA